MSCDIRYVHSNNPDDSACVPAAADVVYAHYYMAGAAYAPAVAGVVFVPDVADAVYFDHKTVRDVYYWSAAAGADVEHSQYWMMSPKMKAISALLKIRQRKRE